MPQSLSARLRAVEEAMWARNHGLLDDAQRWYPSEVFDDHVIARRGEHYYRVPWTRSEDGKVEFGEPEQVEQQYVPVEVREARACLLEAEGDRPRGSKWRIEIICPGWSENGFYYSRGVLAEAAPLFEGSRVYVFADTATGHKKRRDEKHIRHLSGWIDSVAPRSTDGVLEADLNFLAVGEHVETVAKLVEAWDRGKRDLFGVSIDASAGSLKPNHRADGRTGILVESIAAVSSTDVVINPAAGGRFAQLLESAGTHTNQGGVQMKPQVQRMLRILEARRPAALEGIDRETATADQLIGVMTPAELQEAFTPERPAAPPASDAGTGGENTEMQEALREVRVERSAQLAGRMIQESRLLEAAQRVGGEAGRAALQKRLDRRFEGQVLTRDQIQEALDDERELLAALSPARPHGLGATATTGAGGTRVEVGPDKATRIHLGLARRMLEAVSLPVEDYCDSEGNVVLAASAIRAASRCGLRDAYSELTGRADPTFSGVLHESVEFRDGNWGTREMLQEAVTGSTFPRVMANVMHQVLLAGYREIDYGEQHLITSRERAEDFRDYESINVGGFPDLADFSDPDGDAEYDEVTAPSEESEKYKVGTKGDILTITRETIINDKVGVVARMSQMRGQAARRTHARFVFNRVLSNPTMADGVALFHTSRGNLRTVAASADELEEISKIFYGRTNAGGHDTLGLEIYQVFIPRALRKTFRNLNKQAPGATEPNDWEGHFGDAHERIHVTSFMSDANNFLSTAAPGAVGGLVEMRYLFGQEEPEVFIADNPAVGQMLVGDRLQEKLRHEYGGTVPAGAWRAFVMSIVA